MIQNPATQNTSLLGRVDFDQNLYDELVQVKGRSILWETAMACPCRTDRGQPLPGCRNCTGIGWLFVNPKKTNMVVRQVNVITDYRPWSEELRGTAMITARQQDLISFMDRITLLESTSVYSQVLELKAEDDGRLFSYFTYEPVSVVAIGKWTSQTSGIEWLSPDKYQITGKFLTVPLGSDLVAGDTLTVRYIHHPVLHVIELQREVIETYRKINGIEQLQQLPLSAIARRAQYVLGNENLDGTITIDNSFTTQNC